MILNYAQLCFFLLIICSLFLALLDKLPIQASQSLTIVTKAHQLCTLLLGYLNCFIFSACLAHYRRFRIKWQMEAPKVHKYDRVRIQLSWLMFLIHSSRPIAKFRGKTSDLAITNLFSFHIHYLQRVIILCSSLNFFFYGSTALYGPGPPRFVEVSWSHTFETHHVR
jgi:hypothetical protein